MAPTQYQKSLIEDVAKSDTEAARRDAYLCVVEDRTQKNEAFCRKYREILSRPEAKTIEIPPNLSGIVEVDDEAFRPERYLLSEREKPLLGEILSTQKACGRLAELGIRYTNATMLHGKSGTGKTMFARYVAHETDLPLVSLNFGWLVDPLMGKTGRNLSLAFKFAKEHPCVFFLDEIDCISLNRAKAGGDGTAGEIGRITITLMQEFDRLPNETIVIGATNRLDRVDEALVRRFTRTHEVVGLTADEMKTLMDMYLADTGITLSEDIKERILTDSASQADMINRIIRAAAEMFAREKNREGGKKA